MWIRVWRCLLVLAVLNIATPSRAQQAKSAEAQGISDVLEYIGKGWGVLTRSMEDCKTVAEEKFRAQSMMYVPADEAVPAKAKEVGQRCNVRVEPLPEARKIGSVDLSKIKQPGLLYLPEPYVVPGGMFNEMYGWDSYFIIRGLVEEGRTDLARSIAENFFYEIDHYGAVLNANRTYYLTRSQPPFLSSMVMAVYESEKKNGRDLKEWLARAYDYVVRDHEFWTTGDLLAGDTGLSRFYDFGEGPVPESFGHEDRFYDVVARWFMQHPEQANGYLVTGEAADKLPATWPKYTVQLCGGMSELALEQSQGKPATAKCERATRFSFTPDYYKGDRAMRASGYDISFRYGPFSGSTHHYAGVDINSLLYKEEMDLEKMATLLGKTAEARQWSLRAQARKTAVDRLLWDEQRGLYMDYDFARGRRSDYVFVTTFHPLWAGLASPQQAKRVMQNLGIFEQGGGLVTSRNDSKVQWDWPWGWPPNQMLGVEGMRRYGFNDEANRIALKYLATVVKNFRRDATIREKYNVVTCSSEAEIQAGYKENVIGFGWTNGTFLVLLHQLSPELQERVNASAQTVCVTR
jgi:alpha,alpha-trehalase